MDAAAAGQPARPTPSFPISGTIAGAVTMKAGATPAPGLAGSGRLTLGSTPTLQSGSTLAVELGGTTAGSSHDQILVTSRLLPWAAAISA